ncbi:MAG: outer membrane protein transport protein [Balneolales bacterium]|nr:outer membrane protein transport protein [Balneolales bacterium]
MKSCIKSLFLLLFLTGFTATELFAGGYQLNLFGQRQIGMAHTGTGLALDYATISMNPAGMSYVDGNGLLFGTNATFLNTTFRTGPDLMPGLPADVEESTIRNVRTPFSVYAGFDTGISGLKAGLGVYTPYGNSIEWDENWMYRGLLTRISLTSVYIQPTLSFQLTDQISVGAGLIYAIGSVNLQRNPDLDLSMLGIPGPVPLDVELDGNTSAFGFNAGVYYQHNEAFSVGVAYRSKINMSVDGGDATFTLPSSIPDAVVQQLFPADNTFKATLPLPAVLSIGTGIRASEVLRMAIDFNLTFWSAYESLAFNFADNTAALQDSEEPRDFNDSFSLRIGAEYDATRRLQLRIGTYFDQSPVTEGYITPETPDVHRFGITAGLGFEVIRNLEVNASMLYITSRAREQCMCDASAPGTPTIVPVGEFQTNAFIPGFSIGYNF